MTALGAVERPGGAGRLENNANNSAPPSPRGSRYRLRRLLREVSSLSRVTKCGRTPRANLVGVRGVQGGPTGFSGLVTCGSVWACPVCASKILATRSLELGVALLAWEGRGGRLVMGTLTMRHHAGVALVDEWSAAMAAWSRVTGSAGWRKWMARLGAVGWVRVTECTDGQNGWHVHLHFVLLVAGPAPRAPEPTAVLAASTPPARVGLAAESSRDEVGEVVRAFAAWLVPKWDRALLALGQPGALAVGQDVHVADGVQAAADLGGYLAKSTPYSGADLGREVMGSLTKTARSEHSTWPVWSIAERFRETGEVDLLERWGEWERGSHGRRQVAWSRGLRDLLAVGAEKSDDEVADESLGTEDLLYITKRGWATVQQSTAPESDVLDALHANGLPGLRKYARDHGIETMEVGA